MKLDDLPAMKLFIALITPQPERTDLAGNACHPAKATLSRTIIFALSGGE
jgi:hypothetical protein